MKDDEDGLCVLLFYAVGNVHVPALEMTVVI